MTRWQTTIRGSDAICWGSFVTPTYELQFMVDTAQAMQDGSYQGGAELIDRSLTVVGPR